jgi:H+/gluconate symporter-like permease
MKILEYLVLIGFIVGLCIVFLFEILDLFLFRPIYQKLFKKKKRRRRR